MNQQERQYYDHTADPSTMIMYKKIELKEKILKYSLATIGSATALFLLIVVLHVIANI